MFCFINQMISVQLFFCFIFWNLVIGLRHVSSLSTRPNVEESGRFFGCGHFTLSSYVSEIMISRIQFSNQKISRTVLDNLFTRPGRKLYHARQESKMYRSLVHEVSHIQEESGFIHKSRKRTILFTSPGRKS